MRANNRKDMDKVQFSPLIMKLIRRLWNVPRADFRFSSFLGLSLLIACLSGCAPPPPGENQQNPSSAAANELPDITEEMIRERINGTRVRDVPEESGTAEPIIWNFDEDEPKEIAVVEKQTDGERATLVLNIKTKSAPGVRNPRSLAGQIRTQWQLRTGWVLRRWEIVKTENISLKYKNIPKPSAQESKN